MLAACANSDIYTDVLENSEILNIIHLVLNMNSQEYVEIHYMKAESIWILINLAYVGSDSIL